MKICESEKGALLWQGFDALNKATHRDHQVVERRPKTVFKNCNYYFQKDYDRSDLRSQIS